MRRLIAAWMVAVGLVAQTQTFIVDAANGPGTHYTSINVAVAAVPDGSTLLVRAGTYGPVLINAKGITILCEANVSAGGTSQALNFLRVQNTQPGQVVTVRGLQCALMVAFVPTWGLVIENALGPVTFDGAGMLLQLIAPQAVDGITITNSPQVAIQDVRVWGKACRATGSDVLFERCELQGRGASLGISGQAGLVAINSRVHLVHTDVRGGNGEVILVKPQVFLVPGGEAVNMTTSTLRALGLSNHEISGGITPAFTGPAVQLPSIVGNGSARVDAPMSMNAAAPGIAVTRPVMPSLVTAPAAPGSTLVASRHGAPGILCAVLLSLRGATLMPAWLSDPVWLDPGTMHVEAIAITPVTGPLVVQKAVPNVAALRGFHLIWQAADITPGGFEVSNASPSSVF